MENNDLDKIEILEDEDDVVEQSELAFSEKSTDQYLTNEQKLEYLSKLIQEAERNLESNDISKKLVRKSGDLKR